MRSSAVSDASANPCSSVALINSGARSKRLLQELVCVLIASVLFVPKGQLETSRCRQVPDPFRTAEPLQALQKANDSRYTLQDQQRSRVPFEGPQAFHTKSQPPRSAVSYFKLCRANLVVSPTTCGGGPQVLQAPSSTILQRKARGQPAKPSSKSPIHPREWKDCFERDNRHLQ
jgi:hypothetical protein